MPAWVPSAIGAGLGLASSLFGDDDEEQEIKLDPLTEQVRSTLFLPTGRAGTRGDIYNVWDLPEATYGPTPGFRVYQGPTPEVSGFYQGLMGRASGLPYERAAGDYATQAVRGGYLGSNPAAGFLGGYAYGGATNPWLDALVNQAQRRTAGNVASMFGRSGMGGSSLENQVATRQLGDVASQMYGRAYESDMGRRLQAATTLGQLYGQERGLQQEAAFNVPQLTIADLSRLQAGLEAAQGIEGYGTRRREETRAAHQFGQQAPYDRLGFISSAFSGMPTGSRTTVEGQGMNPFLAATGGALAGYGLYRGGMFGGPGGQMPPAPTPYRTGATVPSVGAGGYGVWPTRNRIPGYP